MVGTGRGAQLGILIKGPEALESTRSIDTVVLDKTGTVTTGVMTVAAVLTAEGEDADRVLAVAAAVEHASEHPIGRAITAGIEPSALLPVRDFANLQGRGVRGVVDGHGVLVGRPSLLTAEGLDLPSDLAAAIEQAQAAGPYGRRRRLGRRGPRRGRGGGRDQADVGRGGQPLPRARVDADAADR